MICPECDTVMHMDSVGTCACISCGYKTSQNPKATVYNNQEYSNKGLVQGETPSFHDSHDLTRMSEEDYDNVHKFAPNTGLKFDGGKLRYSLIPPSATKALATVLTFGAQKYEPNNWQKVENGKERYLDAAMRHLESYRSGEKLDLESNLSHLSHLLTNIAFLIHFEEKGGDA